MYSLKASIRIASQLFIEIADKKNFVTRLAKISQTLEKITAECCSGLLDLILCL
jgi:hypothetical protein